MTTAVPTPRNTASLPTRPTLIEVTMLCV
jgi:hypothetical protein